eukprot:5433998-Prymnesium_polylepis.2
MIGRHGAAIYQYHAHAHAHPREAGLLPRLAVCEAGHLPSEEATCLVGVNTLEGGRDVPQSVIAEPSTP